MFKDKKILVTGGTGSFGNIIVKRLLEYNPKEIRIFSRDEKKQDDMSYTYKGQKNIRFIIGDVRDERAVKNAMIGIAIVFHAAALKQVPNSEYNVIEAVKTNILGAQNVIDAALETNVEKVVAISTDKAVEPVNVMGMTKAIQERLVTVANHYKGDKKTKFCCVRYGNVLGSRGSVIPLFKKQIAEGKPLTVTYKDMTRFILTLNQAIDLVFFATEHTEGGEIFVLKVPSHTVIDLAEVMLEELKANNKKIIISGIRPGEKIHETLISPTESLRTVEKKDFFIILPQLGFEEIKKRYPEFKENQLFRYSSDNAHKIGKKELKELLKKEAWV